MIAVVHMRQFPREIEADLLFRGIDIADWHQGRMSSRRLMCLIDALPDDSAYWKERRDGDWSATEYINAAIVNELRLLRADQAAIHTEEKMDINLVESPSQRKQDEQLAERSRQARSRIMSELHGQQN